LPALRHGLKTQLYLLAGAGIDLVRQPRRFSGRAAAKCDASIMGDDLTDGPARSPWFRR
jgi:hypothetical protein